MKMEELEIIILRDGTVQVRTRGFTGNQCLTATKELEEATGTVTERNLTSAYYEKECVVKDDISISCRNEEE